MVSIWQAAAAVLAMNAIVDAGHVISADGGLRPAMPVGKSESQHRLLRSEKPMRPLVRKNPGWDDDSTDSSDGSTSNGNSADPYAPDPISTDKDPTSTDKPEPPRGDADSSKDQYVQAHQTQSTVPANPTFNGDSPEIRQLVNGSTPTANIQLGTPEKDVLVILDTGSDALVVKSWSSVQNMIKRMDPGVTRFVRPTGDIYNRDTSDTYVQTNSSPNSTKIKTEYIEYGSGPAVVEEGKDIVTVGNETVTQFPVAEIVFDALAMLHTAEGIAGILGLQHMLNNSHGESFFTRARSLGKMEAFSYCRGDNDDGSFIWNDKATDGYEIDVLGQIHWAVNLEDVKMVSVPPPPPTPEAPTPVPQPDPDDIIVVRPSKVTRSESLQQDDDAVAHGLGTPVRSHFAQGPNGNYDNASSTDGSVVNDPELEQEIGKIVGDIIDKVVEKYGGNNTNSNYGGDGGNCKNSTELCSGSEQCTAILDTGSNIIAGPYDGLMEFVEFASVNPDCSNFDTLPNIHLSLGGYKVVLPPKAYVMEVNMPSFGGDYDYGGGGGGGGGGGYSDTDDASADPSASGDPIFGANGLLDFSRHRSKKVRKWYRHIKRMHIDHGVNLSAAMRGISVRDLVRCDKMCMPSFVPLDGNTAFGKLWIVGTPLFSEYYTRWSWKQNESKPSVFLADKRTATACIGTAAQQVDSSTDPAATTKANDYDYDYTDLLVHEVKVQPHQFRHKRSVPQSHRGRPRPVNINDIRFPHWARGLKAV